VQVVGHEYVKAKWELRGGFLIDIPDSANPHSPRMKARLDQLLVTRGLYESREKAQRAIMAGEVKIGGHVVDKAGTKVAEDAQVEVKEPERYVGRGGFKMEAALREFHLDPMGWTCLDIGASTGGFTDCLLQHGAARVWAIDVGHDQLAWRIRNDPRVEVREGLNARYLTAEDIPELFELIVIDVSFISLTLILPPAVSLLKPGGVIVPLIKPQFELRRDQIARGGVVREPALHDEAVDRVRRFVSSELPTLEWLSVVESPLKGGEGNTEFLAWLRARSA
jgi:23S rRNA (cytidine1920-2'-O)/16S rRNA (cytidine1409-2'-O)-methyltransferase